MTRILPETGKPNTTPQLIDQYGRTIRYLRLAVTDRCNLRCRYCMPEDGVPDTGHDRVLRFEEMHRLVRLFVSLGVDKVRITGGEPFARKGTVEFLAGLTGMMPADRLFLTTNGVATHRHLAALARMGIGGINLSLDTLRPDRFARITRRPAFTNVQRTLEGTLACGLPLKINTVVMGGVNDDEIPAFVDLARRHPVQIRFIEQMGFNGTGRVVGRRVPAEEIMRRSAAAAGAVLHWRQAGTAQTAALPGGSGSVGVIAAESRSFCGSCDRIRLTATGGLQTCLYGGEVCNVRDRLRAGATDEELAQMIMAAVANRYADGHQAEQHATSTRGCSMATIGG